MDEASTDCGWTMCARHTCACCYPRPGAVVREAPPTVDMIDHPPHYATAGVECIDALRACMTPEEFRGFLRGCALKYLWRLNTKDAPAENAAKAQWYLELLAKEVA